MSPSEMLQLAGEAAEILETMGYVAVGRLRDDKVTLSAWKVVGNRQLTHVHIVDGSIRGSQALAHACAAEFRAEHGITIGT